MSEIDICYMSASELAQRYRDRSLSPVEVVKALIARAENINPKLNAFTYTFYEEALDLARISEKKFLRKSNNIKSLEGCLLYTSPSPRDVEESRMPSSA